MSDPKEPSLGEMLKHAAFICETYDADLVPNLRTTLARRLEKLCVYRDSDNKLPHKPECPWIGHALAREIRGDA